MDGVGLREYSDEIFQPATGEYMYKYVSSACEAGSMTTRYMMGMNGGGW